MNDILKDMADMREHIAEYCMQDGMSVDMGAGPDKCQTAREYCEKTLRAMQPYAQAERVLSRAATGLNTICASLVSKE
jgi:hypothetical protein